MCGYVDLKLLRVIRMEFTLKNPKRCFIYFLIVKLLTIFGIIYAID